MLYTIVTNINFIFSNLQIVIVAVEYPKKIMGTKGILGKYPGIG